MDNLNNDVEEQSTEESLEQERHKLKARLNEVIFLQKRQKLIGSKSEEQPTTPRDTSSSTSSDSDDTTMETNVFQSSSGGFQVSRMFKKRVGAGDQGKNYELLCIASIILNLTNDEPVEDFEVSSNNADFGAFDDIVVEIKYKGKKEREIFAIQLKQKQNDKKVLTVAALGAETGPTALKKYLENYLRTTNLHDSVNMILYTTSATQLGSTLQITFENQVLDLKVKTKQVHKYLSTSDTGTCYTFTSANKQYKKFFKHFYLYAGQAGFKKLEVNIQNYLQNKFECDEAVFMEFHNFLSLWGMKEGKKHKLNKELVKRVITMSVVSPYIRSLSFSPRTTNKREKIFREATSRLGVVKLKTENYPKIKSLWADVMDEVDDITDINKVRIKYQVSKKNINTKEDLFDDEKRTNKLLWFLGKCPLVINECPQTRKASEFCKSKTENFIILRSMDEETTGSDVQTLSDLNQEEDIYEEVVDNFTYSLEGQKEAPLRNLLETIETDDKITLDDLAETMKNPLAIGREREELPSCHIPRILSKIVINSEYLKKVKRDTLIMITCVDKIKVFQKHLTDEITMKNIEDVEKIRDPNMIYVSEEEYSQSEICDLCVDLSAEVNCHQFKYLDEDHLEWISSTTDISDLKDFQFEGENYSIDESELNENSSNTVNILSGDPGMGKSTLAASLKKNSSSEFWTILIPTWNHVLPLKRADAVDVEKFFEYILRSNYGTFRTSLEEAVFINLLKRHKLQIIWDGMDQVSSDDSLEYVLQIVKNLSERGVQQWITTRNNLKELLEKKLCTLSRNIYPFDEEKQQLYMQQRLQGLNLRPEELSNIESKIQLFANNDILKIPLQNYMLTQLFYDDQSKYLKLLEELSSIADLYEYFVEEKFRLYYVKTLKYNLDLAVHDKTYKQAKKFGINCYQKAAFDLYFEHNVHLLNKFRHFFRSSDNDYREWLQEIKNEDPRGLITRVSDDNIPEFSHNSYGEYFAALYLAGSYDMEVRNKSFILKENHKNIRLLLDLILSKGSKAHVAVVSRNYKLLEDCIENDFKRKDTAKRNILELACSWCEEGAVEFSTNISNFENFVHDFENFRKGNIKNWKYEQISQDFKHIENSKPLLLCLKQFLLLFPNLIPLYRKATNQEKYKKLFVAVALYYGIKCDYPSVFECVELLWKKPFKDFDVKFVLTFAIQSSSPQCIKALASQRYECGKILQDNMDIALKMCHSNLVKVFYLLSENKSKLINYAASNGDDTHLKFLIDNGVDVNTVDDAGLTPIHCACWYKKPKNVKFLIMRGAKLDVADKNSLFPIHYACQYGKYKTVQLLIDHGAEVNVGSNGPTPLHYACMNESDSLEIVKLLIETGAEKNVTDQNSKTPFDYAQARKLNRIMRLLKEK